MNIANMFNVFISGIAKIEDTTYEVRGMPNFIRYSFRRAFELKCSTLGSCQGSSDLRSPPIQWV